MRSLGIVSAVCLFLAWSGPTAFGAAMPGIFSVEISPAVNTPDFQQEAIIYHFDGERVRSRWKRTARVDVASNSGGKVRTTWVTETVMEGTYREKILHGEQRSKQVRIEPPGRFYPDHPGGPVMEMVWQSQIEGQLQPDNRIKARSTTHLVSTLTLVQDQGGGFRWVSPPTSPQEPGVLEFWIALPSDNWFVSRYILASGRETLPIRNALERLDRYLTETADNLDRGQYPLARRQVETIRSEIIALIQSLGHGEGTTSITFRGLPTDGTMVRREQLRYMMEKWQEAYQIVNEALAETQRQLTDLSRVLSANVFKAILKNYVSWCGSIPTDLVSGVTQVSTITQFADMPRGFLDWYTESLDDGTVLNNQFRRKQALESLRVFYEGKRERVVEERRKVSDEMRKIDEGPLPAIDNSLATFFRSLKGVSWQPSPERIHPIRDNLEGDDLLKKLGQPRPGP